MRERRRWGSCLVRGRGALFELVMLFLESGGFEKGAWELGLRPGVSDGKGRCPLTPRRAVGPLDTLFYVSCSTAAVRLLRTVAFSAVSSTVRC